CPAVVETALRYSAYERHRAAFENGKERHAIAGPLALVATPGRLALAGTDAAAEALARVVLLDTTIYIADVHANVTCRNRSTSPLGRSCLSAAKVAFTSETGLLEPKLFVRISWMPAASHTARTADPAITPAPGAAGIRITWAAP